jgi:four helix bundle protein
MKFQDWLAQIPSEITDDPLWKSEVYRLALFLGDLAWHDAVKVAQKPFARSLADQLLRAAGSISANVCEGYSRASGKDQARFYEYALGSAREARDWYFKARNVLEQEATDHRLNLLSQIIRQLLRMVPKYRGNALKEDGVDYET